MYYKNKNPGMCYFFFFFWRLNLVQNLIPVHLRFQTGKIDSRRLGPVWKSYLVNCPVVYISHHISIFINPSKVCNFFYRLQNLLPFIVTSYGPFSFDV